MVSVWVTNGAIIADGQLVLSDGRTFTLSDIPGQGFNQNRLNKIIAAVQSIIDVRLLIADIPDGDLDQTPALAGDDAFFLATYGGRVFLDGNERVTRSTLIDITFENGELIPHLSVVE